MSNSGHPKIKKRWSSLSWVHGLWVIGTVMIQSAFPYLQPAKFIKWAPVGVSHCTHSAWWLPAFQIFWQELPLCSPCLIPRRTGFSSSVGKSHLKSSTLYPRAFEWQGRCWPFAVVLRLCGAWVLLDTNMVEGLAKIVHNLWSMWIIFLWHLKNSWQKEKCWVKGNNPLLPSPSFGCCKSCWKGLWEICWIGFVVVLPVH